MLNLSQPSSWDQHLRCQTIQPKAWSIGEWKEILGRKPMDRKMSKVGVTAIKICYLQLMKTCHLNSCCWVASMGKKQNNSFATSPRPSREHWDMAVAHCCVSCLSRWKCLLFPTLSWGICGCISILCTIWLCVVHAQMWPGFKVHNKWASGHQQCNVWHLQREIALNLLSLCCSFKAKLSQNWSKAAQHIGPRHGRLHSKPSVCRGIFLHVFFGPPISPEISPVRRSE